MTQKLLLLLTIWTLAIEAYKSYSYNYNNNNNNNRRIGRTTTIIKKNTKLYNNEKSLWTESVEYVDISSAKEGSTNARSVPLFLLTGAFFPEGTTYLNIFEMKYRTMMFDISQSDDIFGYIHTNPSTGQIAKVGTLCKVIDRQLLDDGRQYIALDGIGRFQVNKILKTLPYVVAEIEPNYNDKLLVNEETINEAIALETQVYDALKYYMRLMKTYEANREMVVSQSTKRNRPTVDNCTRRKDISRMTNFSFSLANMIQMSQTRESQLLLQTDDIIKRLKVELDILTQAGIAICEQLLKMNIITPERQEDIKSRTFGNDYDADILPIDVIETEETEEKDEWDLSNII